MQYKIENDTLIPAPVNFKTPTGWICNFNLNIEAMNANGYTLTEADAEEWRKAHPVIPPVRTQCTKYDLVTCLQTNFPELFANLRQAYAQSADLQFYWNSVLDLDRGNTDFQAIVSNLGITDAQLDEIFARMGA